jgi:hypothetical protein
VGYAGAGVSQRLNVRALPLVLSGTTIYPTAPILYESPDLSPFEDVFWDQKGEGGVPPGGWCQNYAITELNVKNSDQTNSRFRKLSRSSRVR